MKAWNTLAPERQAALYADEEQLEMFSLDAGIARYREERLRNDSSNGSPEQELIGRYLQALTTAVLNLQDSVSQGNAHKGVTYWGYPILALDAEKLAFLTLAEIVNHADGPENSVTAIASAIGQRAKVEREFALIRQEAPDIYARVKRRNKKWTRRAHRTAKTKAGVVDNSWTLSTRIWLGTTLLELAVKHTDILVVERFVLKGKSQVRIGFSPEVRDAIEKAHGDSELLRPFYLPMVVPPCEWGDQRNGGYLFHRVPLIKPNVLGGSMKERDEMDLPEVRTAVSGLQISEWQINERTLAVMDTMWQAGGGWAGLPSALPTEVPPPTFDWGSGTKEQKIAWKLEATLIHDANARVKSKRKAILHKIWLAKRFSDYEVIYFPHQLDWRGRSYPVASHLHPQSDDPGRALLQFACGKPLGSEGLHWLKVHLANCYGVDKVPFAARVEWVNANLQPIRQSAQMPLDYRWWADGDDPWQTLAACFVLADATAATVCHLPVQMDGSCNGLQHYSAMGLDEVGGSVVNLIPAEKPNDVYQQVADRVTVLIGEDVCGNPNDQPGSNMTPPKDTSLNSNDTSVGLKDKPPRKPQPESPSKDTSWDQIKGERREGNKCKSSVESSIVGLPCLPVLPSERGMGSTQDQSYSSSSQVSSASLGLQWQGRVDRKVVKRATMTIVYGLSRAGMKNQFIEDGHCDFHDGNRSLLATYLRDKTWFALEGTLVGASAIMEWLRVCASMAAHHEKSVRWFTPIGFFVIQEYLEQRNKHLYTAMQKLTIREPDMERGISVRRQMRGLPPNFVHSFDAAHMMLTTNSCLSHGITDLSMIHDSYGTHACDIPILNRILRQEFVKMYSVDRLSEVHQQWCTQVGLDLPPPPSRGGLDLAAIIKSEYFFG